MTNQPSLFTLPPELRLQIYTYVLGPSKPLLLSPSSKLNTWSTPPISRVSQALRLETLPLYFALHDFTYDLRSPLDLCLRPLERVLQSLSTQNLRLRCLRFKHVSRGVLSTAELEAWVRIMALYRCVLPLRVENVTFCQGPLRYRDFAARVAVALRQLVRFARGLDERIWGSGEEVALGVWVGEVLERTEEGRAVLRGIAFAGEVVRGFRDAEAGARARAEMRWWSGVGGMGSSVVIVS